MFRFQLKGGISTSFLGGGRSIQLSYSDILKTIKRFWRFFILQYRKGFVK